MRIVKLPFKGKQLICRYDVAESADKLNRKANSKLENKQISGIYFTNVDGKIIIETWYSETIINGE